MWTKIHSVESSTVPTEIKYKRLFIRHANLSLKWKFERKIQIQPILESLNGKMWLVLISKFCRVLRHHFIDIF